MVSQGIIEPTTSPWACEAFYVNKRSEQVRGKLRLVINYQPLNHFLADDKFPLPQKKSLFQHLADARVLSKFDLKSGFWQLGIKPEDRPKTAFCIPDHHYQWKVMPFGLKNAPSAFQKAMITIFEPILANTLVYIDDILLFSPDEQSHAELLSKFYSLVAKYGIMLSEKKMEVGVTTIQFLGMEISDGKYQPQPHVAQELLKFPDELSSQKMIQQFLGLVNYMADFLPKLSHHTALLFPMLKKNPPQWTSRQTEAVKAIKCLAEKMPPLKIPASSEKRILQTDASDECWGAVLLVQDNNNKRHVCGYKSGTFKASEHHYHSTFKEILAVKRGIEKFLFHLIGHEF
ncbi:putative reverse transcriptase domain, viral movement protein [Tanacetum coccineum]